MRRQLTYGALAAVLLVVTAGCNPKDTNRSVSISGKVMYQNKPVTGGNLTIYVGETPYPVGIGPDGSYSAVQLPEGEAVATVNNDALNTDKPKDSGKTAMVGPAPKDRSQAPTGAFRRLPPKYKEKKTSDLKVTLVKGKMTHDFELKD
jgi:hypothetical protein